MNIWLLGLGVVGILVAAVWYVVLLRDFSPGLHVRFMSKGDMPTRSLYLWVLVVLLSASFVVNSFPGDSSHFSIIGGVAAAFLLSELARWWHNSTLPAEPGDGPTERPRDR